MDPLGSLPPGSGPRPDQRLNSPVWIHAVAWGGIVLLVLLLNGVAWLYRGQNPWNGWTASRELRRPAYAERIYAADLFRTQANTWSNLAYVLVGFYALALGWRDLRRPPPVAANYVSQTPAMSFLFGAACCQLGLGSGLFHASLSRWGQQLDVAAMYSPLLVCLAIHLGRWARRATGSRGAPPVQLWPLLAGLVVVASYLLYRYKWSMSSGVVLPTLILSVGGFGLLEAFLAWRQMQFRWLLLATAALVAARLCWLRDVAGKFSGPDAWLQGHAVWHLLTSLSLACAYAYYRSERSLEPHGVPPAAPTRAQ
jgi:hypothetical protein